MLRMATYTGFVHDQLQIRDRLPIHRTGAVLFACNYSTANRTIYVDYSLNAVTWTVATLNWIEGTNIVVPYGIVIAGIRVPTHQDMMFWRIRLDQRADGDGVFVQLENASPVPDHPLL